MALTISFWIMAVVMVAAALSVVFLRNVFRAALMLILCFIAVAGIYITLSADFLAAVQILVYVGAISVLIILAIMMTKNFKDGDRANKLQLPVGITAAVILGILVYAVTQSPWKIATESPLSPTAAPLANALFSQNGYILPVEIGAVMLLAAIIGAIIITRDK